MPRHDVTSSRGVGRSALLVCVAVALFSGACGGSSSSNPPPSTPPTETPPSNQPVSVTGTERLGWTQMASSTTELRGFTFFAYVDGSRSPLSDARCGSSDGPSGFDCSAALPSMTVGQHVIELATVGTAGVESARSPQLTVNMVGSGSQSVVQTDLPASSQTASSVTIASCGSGTWQCTPLPGPAAGLGVISALESLPDGRVLAVESGTRILVQQGDRWSIAYAVANDPRMPTHIAAVARDSAFDNTHFVYVAEVTAAVDGTRTARVLRSREVANQLGEFATIVAGEALAQEGDPLLSVGSDGLVYVAVPGDPSATNSGMRQGRLLRFAPDGSAAGTAGAGSATLTEIAPAPTSLAWDPQGRLWLAATGDPSATPVNRMEAAVAARWTRKPVTLSPPLRDEAAVQAIAFGASLSSAGAAPVYVVADSPAVLYRGMSAGGAKQDVLTSLTPLPLGEWEPGAVAVHSDGSLVVAARQHTGAGDVRSLLHLTPSRVVSIPN